MTARNITTRLAKIEESISQSGEEGTFRLYVCQGPVAMDAHEYLRGLGYEFSTNSIVVKVVDAIDGRPADLPAADLTPKYAPQNALTEFGG